MCGIALIISGVPIDLSSLLPNASDYYYSSPLSQHSESTLFTVDDIKAALRRRGPDSLGSKSLSLHVHEGRVVRSSVEEEEEPSKLSNSEDDFVLNNNLTGKVLFVGATLQLRGVCPITQPLVDKSGNILTIWFGRDALGRRSLLIHWPSIKDTRLILSSVSPPALNENSDFGSEKGPGEPNFWEELPCGVYSLSMNAAKMDENLMCEVKRHNWLDPMLQELITWDRPLVEPTPDILNGVHNTCFNEQEQQGHLHKEVLAALTESVRRRAIFSGVHMGNSPVAVLFSGGLDSMILAALLDQCLDPKYEIDLLNVSFDGQLAPDRISARAGVNELRKIATLRRWNLVEIDAELSKLTMEMQHVMSLINPSNTYMDLNIGIALWLAAGGDGWLSEEIGGESNNYSQCQHVKYKSESRILLVGAGADEQCAGYGRHKTKYRQSRTENLRRIWKRNLGRDDRCIADNGKEARFPFLDEDVIRLLLNVPLWEIADLRQPSGVGDKKILRERVGMLMVVAGAGGGDGDGEGT
ncbi:hypothetical protein M8C21_020060, partial [Ambrosia artemisiifolia]